MSRSFFPPLEYPLTRRYEWKWLSLIAYSLGFVVVVILCLLNVALVGYDTVTEFESNFNVTQTFWFDGFLPSALKRRKRGTLCSSRLFNVGESMVTENAFFNWKVGSVYKANAGGSGFSYKGESLENCDITQIEFLGDLRTWSLEGTVYMFCAPPEYKAASRKPEDWELAGVASFGVSALPAKQTNFQRMAKSAGENSTVFIVSELLSLSGIDLGSQFYSTFAASNASGIITYSILADFEFCPISHSRDPASSCGQSYSQPPNITFTAVTAVTNDNMILPENALTLTDTQAVGAMYELDPAVRTPTLNFLHLAHSAARIDIGNTAPNNFLTNLAVVDATLAAEFPVPAGAPSGTSPARSQLYDTWKSQIGPQTDKPYPEIRIPGPSTLQAVFTCRLSRLKSAGSLIVSVLVATLSMFSTIWGLSLLAVASLAKRDPRANHCVGCGEMHTHGQSNPDGKMMGSYDFPTPMISPDPVAHSHPKY